MAHPARFMALPPGPPGIRERRLARTCTAGPPGPWPPHRTRRGARPCACRRSPWANRGGAGWGKQAREPPARVLDSAQVTPAQARCYPMGDVWRTLRARNPHSSTRGQADARCAILGGGSRMINQQPAKSVSAARVWSPDEDWLRHRRLELYHRSMHHIIQDIN
jgi:hypothetical protein